MWHHLFGPASWLRHGVFRHGAAAVVAIFPDGGEHHLCDPALEGFGLRLVRTQRETIEAGLVHVDLVGLLI